jgi:hypothetical protein
MRGVRMRAANRKEKNPMDGRQSANDFVAIKGIAMNTSNSAARNQDQNSNSPISSRAKLRQFCCVLCIVAIPWLFGGCATAKKVADSEGKGTRRVFKTSYDTAWMASKGAVSYRDLRVLDLDRKGGSILAKRDVNILSFGMDVGVWIRPVTTNETSIEVYCERIWGPGLPPNLEKPLLDTIATLLDQ